MRRALIVANDTYDHDGLSHLRAPAADAEALATVLGAREIGDFRVQVVHNEPAHVVQAEIEELFAEGRPDDLLLLHFSCHGLKSESGELFFAARNTRPNRLASTATSADFVQRCLRTTRARSVVLLLDCCYGGAFSAGVRVRAAGDVNVLASFPAERPGGGRGRAVITASSAMEYAFEGDHLADDHSPRPSVFTSALVDGLSTGEADRDQDGWVSLNELYDYVFDRVREQNPHQTPGRDVEMQGELYLARRPAAVTVPSPLPAELLEAAASPLAGVRAAAVAELAAVVRGMHAGRALAARRSLETFATDDSRAVSAAAAAVLASAPPAGGTPSAPEPTALTVSDKSPPSPESPQPRSATVASSESTQPRSATVASSESTRPPSEKVTPPTGPSAASGRSRPDGPAPLVHPALGPEPPARLATPAYEHPAPGTDPPDRLAAPAGEPARRRWTRRHYVAIGSLGAAALLAVVLLLPGIFDRRGGQGADGPLDPTSASSTSTFSEKAPWRLVVEDRIDDNDSGCRVTVTDTTNSQPTVVENYGTKSYLMHTSGVFSWTATHPRCVVTHQAGTGELGLPAMVEAGHGDTAAISTAKGLTILVVRTTGPETCNLVIRDAADGRQVRTIPSQKPGAVTVLDRDLPALIYFANLECTVDLRET